MAVNWGNHPEISAAERARMLAHAQETLSNNGPGVGATTPPDTQLDNLVYSQFPGGAGSLGGFGGGAGGIGAGGPAATPFGSFTPPDVNQLNTDPTYQFDLAQQQKAIQRGAAARGTLLTGGLQTKLQENASGVAGQHYGDIFNRALQSYGTNRDTNQQNFGQSLGAYNAGLGAFNANTSAALGFGHLGLEAGDQAFRQGQVTRGNQIENIDRVNAANEHQTALQDYAQQVAAQRAQFGGSLSAAAPMLPTPDTRQRSSQIAKWG